MSAKGDFDTLTLGEAAEWYGSRGMPVFPCRPRGKEPLVEGGFRGATCDQDKIREWWSRWPQANIGVPTGPTSGWLVMDIDPRHNGDKTLDTWLTKYGRWPDTAEVITGGGGRHVFFRHVEGLRCGPIGPGVDIKTTGGYVVVAPSVHPSGKAYAWDGPDGAEALARLVEPPGWLLRLARERRPLGAGTPPADGADEPIAEGRRNETLFRIAASLRGKGLTQAAIEAALLAENRARCQPPLPDDEVRRIAESAARYRAGGNNGAHGVNSNQPGDPWVRPRRGINPSRVQSAAEAIAVLNSLDLWKSLRWQRWLRRGDILIGKTECGAEVRIPSRKLLVFDYCAAEILSQTGVAILRPRKGLVRAAWSDIAELISAAVGDDIVRTAPPEEELRHDLRRCYELAGWPTPQTGEELYAVLNALRLYIRAPHKPTAPPAVFWWQGLWHCRLDTLRLWLSTPVASAQFRRIDELEQHAALLGFRPHAEQLQAQHEGDRVRLRTWSAAPEVLEDK